MTVTLEQIHQDLIDLKKEMAKIRVSIESPQLADDLLRDIHLSRKRRELISHNEMRDEFG